MKHIFKKNQIIITALAVMIAVAGYLNYSGTKLGSEVSQTIADKDSVKKETETTETGETGKNSTDSAMIIDAMDILYSGTVDGYCIVSSDSDFTRLAARLRESGMQVIGMGESKTPKPFISACNQFKYLDLLYSNQQEEEKEEAPERRQETKSSTSTAQSKQKDGTPKDKELRRIRYTINSIIDKFSDEEGWLFSGKLGDQLSKRLPDFDVRNYGFSKLTPFVKSLGNYEIEKISNGSGQKQIYIRMKNQKGK